MPLPRAAIELQDTVADVDTALVAVDASIEALPATPLEADLPAIVSIVSDLSAACATLQSVCTTVATLLATTRINQ